MRVRDELTGNEYNTRDILWIPESWQERDRTISHSLARAGEVPRSTRTALPWGLSTDGDCWTPITILEIP